MRYKNTNPTTSSRVEAENGLSELALQQLCFQNLWNNRPDLRGRLFAVNNNSQNAIKGAFNKAVGVLPGVSDMIFLGSQNPVFMEFKLEGGKQSPAQIAWQKTVTDLGYSYVVVRSEVKFLEVINFFE